MKEEKSRDSPLRMVRESMIIGYRFRCPACGIEVRPTDKWCSACGQRLDTGKGDEDPWRSM